MWVISIPSLLGALEQRPEVVVAVDQHTLATGTIGDEVGVGQPLRVLGPLDDQARLLPGSSLLTVGRMR